MVFSDTIDESWGGNRILYGHIDPQINNFVKGVQAWENNFDLIPERHQAFMHKLNRFFSAEAKMAYLEKCAENMTVDEWSKDSGQLLYFFLKISEDKF